MTESTYKSCIRALKVISLTIALAIVVAGLVIAIFNV
jgi:hypothetical protein